MRTKARHYYPPIKKCRGSTLRHLPRPISVYRFTRVLRFTRFLPTLHLSYCTPVSFPPVLQVLIPHILPYPPGFMLPEISLYLG
jgi:hypothetical protein